MSRRVLIASLAVAGALAAGFSFGFAQTPPPDAKSSAAALGMTAGEPSRVVPHDKFVRAVEGWRDARAQMRSLRRSLSTSPDAELSLQIAGIVYGQDWRHVQRCWLSEGYRNAERRERRIVRLNTQGSGASGPAQFMPGTWRSTPFGALDIFNVQAQAFATAYMWSVGRKREWAGAGC